MYEEALKVATAILSLVMVGFLATEAVYRTVFKVLKVISTVWRRRQKLPRGEGFGLLWARRIHGPLQAATASALAWGGAAIFDEDGENAYDHLVDMFRVWAVVALIWAALVTVLILVDAALYWRPFRPDTSHARLVRGYLTMLINLSVIFVVVAMAVVGIIEFKVWQEFSTGLLAAGVLGTLITALAINGTLLNMSAGIVATVSGVVARGDVVDLGADGAGEVQDVSLTHARITVSDQREIAVPLNRFVSAPVAHLRRPGGWRLPHLTWVSFDMEIDGSIPVTEIRTHLTTVFGNPPRALAAGRFLTGTLNVSESELTVFSQPHPPPSESGNRSDNTDTVVSSASSSDDDDLSDEIDRPDYDEDADDEEGTSTTSTTPRVTSTVDSGPDKAGKWKKRDFGATLAVVGFAGGRTTIRITLLAEPRNLARRQSIVRENLIEWLQQRAQTALASTVEADRAAYYSAMVKAAQAQIQYHQSKLHALPKQQREGKGKVKNYDSDD
jgi:small-conductance mechanosensitive channel